MKKIIVLAVTTLMLTTSLSAKPAKGVYVGLGFGASQIIDNGYGDNFTSNFNNAGYAVAVEKGSSGSKIYGGYQFNKIFAIEASYTDYGETLSISATSGSTLYTEIIKPTSVGISANFGYNFGSESEYRPFTKIGFATVSFNESGTGNVYQDTSATAVKFGLGFEYTPASLNGFGFRIAYEGDFFTTTNTYNTTYYQNTYTQGLSLTYISAQYKF